MKIFVKNVKGLKLPEQANKGEDACYDVIATTEPQIIGTSIERPLDRMKIWSRIIFVEYGTNLYLAPEVPKNKQLFHTLFCPRSSVSKTNLILCNSVGTIDFGYRNEIKLRFKYIFSPEDLIVLPEAGVNRVYGMLNNENVYHLGDKIAQMKACKNIPIDFELVDKLPESQRGQGGFGSSGR